MATVVKKSPGETEDKLIAKFRKKIISEQLLDEIKERKFHKPPSVKKKERLAALRRGKGRRRR
jgi:ribosomal protein S21